LTFMGTNDARVTVFTLPDCVKCDELKDWLQEKGVDYDVKSFTTEVQLEFLMNNMFGNPPILEVGETAMPSEVMFPNEVLDEERVTEALGHG